MSKLNKTAIEKILEQAKNNADFNISAIAREHNVTSAAILYVLKKHKCWRRCTSGHHSSLIRKSKTKLTEDQKNDIIARYANGDINKTKLGLEYGVSAATIRRILLVAGIEKKEKNGLHSEETKQRIRILRASQKTSEETRKKMSISRLGVAKTEKAKQNMSKAQQNISPELKKRRSETSSKNNIKRNLLGNDFNVKGYYLSNKSKTSPVPYRSKSIELKLMQQFDLDDNVLTWQSPYVLNYTSCSGAVLHALPDFLVEYKDGRKEDRLKLK